MSNKNTEKAQAALIAEKVTVKITEQSQRYMLALNTHIIFSILTLPRNKA